MRVTHLLTSAVLFVVFSNPTFAQQVLSSDIKPNPALTGINELSVVLAVVGSEPNTDVLKRANLKAEMINRLYDAGFKISRSSADAPELNIKLTALKVESTGQYVVSVRTSLARSVILPNVEERLSIIADAWKMDSGIRIVAAEKMGDEVDALVKEQVQTFIAACSPTVSAERRPDVNQTRTQSRKADVEQEAKPTKQQGVEANYVSSKNSQVFHRPDCPFAQKIKPQNLVTYASREDAIAAGKKPCSRCNP
ncbi:MAG: Ada metal-binding domain-containing protein [Sedimentisphaerales bacterium]|jgi:hypothetical protein